MADYLDLLHIKADEVLTGTYYERRPLTPQDVGETFSYDIVDEPRSAYYNILQALNTTMTTQTIKTSDLHNIKVKGYCVTQEGGLYQIQEIIKQIKKPKTKYALRVIQTTIETEYVLRMVEVDNPWELK